MIGSRHQTYTYVWAPPELANTSSQLRRRTYRMMILTRIDDEMGKEQDSVISPRKDGHASSISPTSLHAILEAEERHRGWITSERPIRRMKLTIVKGRRLRAMMR